MATIVTEVNKGVNLYLKKTKGLLAAGSLGLDCHRTVSPHPSRVRTSSFARQPRTALRLSGANLSLSLRDGHLRCGRRSRETRHCMEQTLAGRSLHCVEQTLAGGSHHCVEQTLAGRSHWPLFFWRWGWSIGLTYCFPPIPPKSAEWSTQLHGRANARIRCSPYFHCAPMRLNYRQTW
jgi:hypothetical protein